MALRRWDVSSYDPQIAGMLAKECGVSLLAASVLAARGHTTPAQALSFLMPDEELASPFALADMRPAVERIQQAVDRFESIAIYGDYDCDGITSTAMLYTYLSSIGADVSWWLPERSGEGYGLNAGVVERLSEEGVRLLITVDNGISACKEALLLEQKGIDLIVTDHHQPGETLPRAVAVINPHRQDCPSEYKDLAGVGVAFKLVAALEGGDYQTSLEYFADLVALGTIGDVVPLTGENRILVKKGIQAMANSDNMGLLALMKTAGVTPGKLDARTIAFSLVPRLNAAGRVSSAALAVKLLLSEEEEEAQELAERLNEMNRQRQEQEQAVLADIEEMIRADRSLLQGRLLILKKPDWNHGILGIVCSKLLERYGKPVLLMSGSGGMLRGSGRSIEGFHLYQALSHNAALLARYGGHKLAAGFTLAEEHWDAFRLGMEQYARERFDLMPQYTYTADLELSPAQLQLEEIESLAVLEPYGAQNDDPLFLLREGVVENVVPLSGGKHQRLSLRLGGRTVTALHFGMESARLPYRVGDTVDLLAYPSVDSFHGTKSLSLKIRDVHPSGFVQDRFFAAKGYYEKIRRGESVSPAIVRRGTPAREEAAALYRFFRKQNGYAGDIERLSLSLEGRNFNYCKLRLLLDILEEAGLLTVSPHLDGITLCPVLAKADLEATPTMRRIRQMGGAGPGN